MARRGVLTMTWGTAGRVLGLWSTVVVVGCGPTAGAMGGASDGGTTGATTGATTAGTGTASGGASTGSTSGSTGTGSAGTSGGSTGPAEGCGDGLLQPGETCDDGNAESFDGCSAACQVEVPIERLEVESGGRSCVLLASGKAKCWGGEWEAIAGAAAPYVGDSPDEVGPNFPYLEGAFETIEAISPGGATSCVVGDGGQLKCWGNNESGELGIERDWLTGWENYDDTYAAWGDDPGETLDALPTVQLGDTVIEAAAVYGRTCARLEGGVKCWGGNMGGSLGLGFGGEDIGDEPGEMGENLPYIDLAMDDVVEVTNSMLCARGASGGVKCWGAAKGYGDLEVRGDEPGEMGENLPYLDLGGPVVDLSVGVAYTACVALADGTARCWGRSDLDGWAFPWPGAEGVIGDEPGEMGPALPVLSVGPGDAIEEVAVGGYFACVRTAAGRVRCWGRNDEGQLGQGHTEVMDVPLEEIPNVDLGEPAVQVGAGYQHACALLASGNVKCWGAGEYLGLGDPNNRGDEPGEMGENLPYVEFF